ncbi:MAG: squalene--hopene cyclase, partial [Planctomycetota bacterium]|nr:squalene--hopene cyclase [Planctomycetota bacterium]
AIVQALHQRYGDDRTFAVPILMNCALANLVAWQDVPALPFELACLPRFFWRAVNLQVVSYALPALIAIGITQHRRAPGSGLWHWLRDLATRPCLSMLTRLQPPSGGFLEAIPLTAFVCLALLASGETSAAALARGLRFLQQTQRPDGSWPIDVNLSLWLTSQALWALAPANRGSVCSFDPDAALGRLLQAQQRQRHPYSGAPAGGWPWTDLPGGVPDVDDTAAALLAIAAWRDRLAKLSGEALVFRNWQMQVQEGVQWLLSLQNPDGGWPTFCRSWRRLPFDRSSPDLTAHALCALAAWHPQLSQSPLAQRDAKALERAIGGGLRYLAKAQQPDGSWLALLFGSQWHADQTNPVIGTARALRCLLYTS